LNTRLHFDIGVNPTDLAHQELRPLRTDQSMQSAFALIGVWHGAGARVGAVCRDLTGSEIYNLCVCRRNQLRKPRAKCAHASISHGAHQSTSRRIAIVMALPARTTREIGSLL
jgi:hypothetical protein